MRIVWRYVLQEFLFSFLVAFAFFFVIFFVNQLLLLAEEILTKDVALFDVLMLIVYALPSIVALSFPFASLVGALMAVGRFSSDNEIIAFQASGIPLSRLFLPMLILGALFSFASYMMNDYFLPRGTIQFGRLYRELLYSNPALELEPYSVKRYQNDILITGNVQGRNIGSFAIIDRDEEGKRRVIVSTDATLTRQGERDAGVISLELSDVFTHSYLGGNRGEYEYARAEQMVYNILLQDITVSIRNPGPREMSARDVLSDIREKERALNLRIEQQEQEVALLRNRLGLAYLAWQRGEGSGEEVRSIESRLSQQESVRIFDRTLQIYRLEYYKKFSIPFACLSFVFLAFPVGLYTRRSGRSVGFGIGLLISLLYWSLLIGGQTFGTQRPEVSPFLSMWLPNVVVVVIGAALFLHRWRR
ncbi:MAG: LptF/LptG family permease [Spirochaetaceae bacterium]